MTHEPADRPPDERSHPSYENAERPPHGVRTMALLRWILIAVMGVVAVLSVAYSVGLIASGSASATTSQYYCPMHPQIVQGGPGECPICSMSLVPKPGGGAKSVSKSVAPSAAHAGHRHNPADPYFCPMHPEETGVDDSARCPICKMKLEKKPPAPPGQPSAASSLPANVPALVPVELSLDRVQLIGIRTAQAASEPLLPVLRAVGVVAADEARVARVHSRFSGWIEQLAAATTGQKVRRGQFLAGIYNLELVPAQQELLAARRWASAAPSTGSGTPSAAGSALEDDARRRLELFGMSRGEVDAVAASGKPARTISVSAPISGFVTRKNAVRGTFVEPGMELFEIADLSKVWVLADVHEQDIARVAVGQQAAVSLRAYPDERFTGKIAFVYPTLDASTRTLRVRVELENPDMKLRPGMYADVTVQLAAATALVIPGEALVDTGEYQYVFLAKEGGRFEPRRVRAGTRAGDKVQILEGIAAGDSVVTTANFLLDSESRLRAAIEGGR